MRPEFDLADVVKFWAPYYEMLLLNSYKIIFLKVSSLCFKIILKDSVYKDL